ncbi:MAG: DUF2520 domain-containing protein [Proteobacteria bacterium]|nr:DUF2520 domain-containing protein [Pseudomonadota bacterium]
MRQVPIPFLSYLIIGDGRMAKHFCHYLNLLNLPFFQWARNKHPHETLLKQCALASHILILISDTQIASIAKQIPQQENQIILHFSGNLTLDSIYSAHPLGTFSHTLYTLEEYLALPFILESHGPPLCSLLPGLTNDAYFIPKALKSYYHALCVLSANFTCILWKKFFHELHNTLNLPPTIGLPYLTQTLQNIQKNPNGALTGPLARNDQQTIQGNLTALKNDPFFDIYNAFVNLFKHEVKS